MNNPLIFLGIIIGLAGAVIILKRPYLGVAFTVLSAPIIDLIPPIPYLSSALPLVGAVTVVGYLLKKRGTGGRIKLRFDIQHLLGLVFIIWILLSNPQAAWSGPDRNWIFTFIQLLVLMVLAGDLLDEPKKHYVLMTLFAVVSVISAFTAISQGYIGEDIETSARVGGFAAGSNDAARYFVVAMVFITYLLSKVKDSVLRFVMLGAIIVTYIGVFYTGSRTGMILLFSAQLLLIAFQKKGKQRIQLLVIFGIAFSLLIALASTILGIIEGIIPAITQGTDTIGLRYQLWRIGWQMWLDHPITGVGIGMFAHRSYFYMTQVPGLMPRAIVSHNMYVQILSETGIVGGILFISIIVRSLMNFWKARHFQNSELLELRHIWLIVFLVMLIGGITKTDQVDKLLWMVMGLSVYFNGQVTTQLEEHNLPEGIPVAMGKQEYVNRH